jgi:hypothetical protein
VASHQKKKEEEPQKVNIDESNSLEVRTATLLGNEEMKEENKIKAKPLPVTGSM